MLGQQVGQGLARQIGQVEELGEGLQAQGIGALPGQHPPQRIVAGIPVGVVEAHGPQPALVIGTGGRTRLGLTDENQQQQQRRVAAPPA